jgi:hypothetical protein
VPDLLRFRLPSGTLDLVMMGKFWKQNVYCQVDRCWDNETDNLTEDNARELDRARLVRCADMSPGSLQQREDTHGIFFAGTKRFQSYFLCLFVIFLFWDFSCCYNEDFLEIRTRPGDPEHTRRFLEEPSSTGVGPEDSIKYTLAALQVAAFSHVTK